MPSLAAQKGTSAAQTSLCLAACRCLPSGSFSAQFFSGRSPSSQSLNLCGIVGLHSLLILKAPHVGQDLSFAIGVRGLEHVKGFTHTNGLMAKGTISSRRTKSATSKRGKVKATLFWFGTTAIGGSISGTLFGFEISRLVQNGIVFTHFHITFLGDWDKCWTCHDIDEKKMFCKERKLDSKKNLWED